MQLKDKRRRGDFGRLGFLLLFWLTDLGNCAHAEQGLSAFERLGRQFYRRGDQHAVVELGHTETKLEGTLFPCANCHGLSGEGKREAGVNIPAINAPALFTDSAARRGYDRQSLEQAITHGLDSNRQPLNRMMPRYSLPEQQLTALMAYLQRLGTDLDREPGITDTEVRLGTLLPLSGNLAETGKLLKATLESCIDDLNSRGPIYGRKLTLAVLDSGGDTKETSLALQNLLFENKVFALVSAYIPIVAEDMYRLIGQENLPVIAPLSYSPNEDSLSTASFFNFLPTYGDQLRALIQYWTRNKSSKEDSTDLKLAIVISESLQNQKLLPEILSYIKRYPQIKLTKLIESHPNLKEIDNDLIILANLQNDAVLFLGNAQEFKQVTALLIGMKNQPVLLSLMGMLGGDVLESQDFSMEKMLLATPFALQKGKFDVFQNKLRRHGIELLSPGLQDVACKALEFVHDGLKQVGKQVNRSLLIDVLKNGNSLNMDFMPTLEFSKDSPYGIRGGYVLNIDNKIGYSHRSEWITVR